MLPHANVTAGVVYLRWRAARGCTRHLGFGRSGDAAGRARGNGFSIELPAVLLMLEAVSEGTTAGAGLAWLLAAQIAHGVGVVERFFEVERNLPR